MQEQRLGTGRKIAVEFVVEHEGPEEDASQKEDKTVNLASLHAEIKEVRALVSTQVEKDESIEKNAEVVLRQLLAELEETVGVSERLQAAAKTSEQQTSIVKHQLEVSLQQSKESAAEAKQQLVTVKEQLRKAQEQNRWAVEAAAEARQQVLSLLTADLAACVCCF
jgi:flagellar biosynthesis/type III secretory pathway chaperone